MRPDRRQDALIPVLIFTATVVAIISSVGAPLLPTISYHLHVPLSTAQWSLTITLLAGTVISPVMGRLGDGPRRRETMIAGLALVTLGGVLAAVAPNLTMLLIGRALQGFGLGLVPLAMAAARDNLPRERVNPTIALLSVAAAAGVGIGYPISGLIADGLGLSAAFWFSALVSGVALLCVVAVVPASAERTAVPLDLPGVLLLTSGLIALLLAIADGSAWGWSSPAVFGLFAGAMAALAAWVRQQLHARAPLVQLRLLRHTAVLTGDGCAMVLGVAMYMYVSAVAEFVQAPHTHGYGFSASVVVTGLCLVPLSMTSFATSRALPWFLALIGARALLAVGALIVGVAGAFFALFHTSLWEAFTMMAILGVGIGSTSAVIPGLILRAVPESETGSAMGFYQVVRYLGFSLGSALTASILAGHTLSGHQLPDKSGYTLTLWIGATICVVASVLAWILPTRGAPPNDDDLLLLEEDAELGPLGVVGMTSE